MSRRYSEAEFHGISDKELARLIEDHYEDHDMSELDEQVEPSRYEGVELPMKTAPDDPQIGYLIAHPCGTGHGFQCLDCGAGIIGQCPVYGVNINPYKATCCQCGVVVVQGCGTELFDGS